MARRAIDILGAATGLLVMSPILLVILFLVWLQDFRSPLYIAQRVACGGGTFRMVKVRSMIVKADRSGVESTSADDSRITPLGHFIRRWKIDELGQLWNVLCGDMSLVGPRPNTPREVSTYSAEEMGLLDVRPGITDFSSIVFSDEGDILRSSSNPDADYARLIRPWKSQLGLLYAHNASAALNLRLIWLTVVAIFDKRRALDGLDTLLEKYGCDGRLREVASRRRELEKFTQLVASEGPAWNGQ
jgi:lipopolysaccharide/colanic/teichoic acid biosynthesis glycosyltransferase